MGINSILPIMKHITICYQTSRVNPRFGWFAESLVKQIRYEDDISVVVVDRLANEPNRAEQIGAKLPERFNLRHVAPKPTVWQGEHRVTKDDWFAASNSRNTGLCLAKDGWIAYVDDLSVLLPSWLQSVREAEAGNYLICGAYRKVRNLVVTDGIVTNHMEFPQGNDNRLRHAEGTISGCSGEWLYGCSCAMPVEALLDIGGWLEICDGLGFEDVCTGLVLNSAGYGFRYDKRMMTFEDEDAHFEDKAMRKTDKGQSPNDKSHAALRIARSGQRYWDNWYDGGLRAERQRVLNGEPWTVRTEPQRDWYDQQVIAEMI